MNNNRVYLGGAVDIGTDNHHWRHHSEWAARGIEVYCPICACQHLTDPADILRRNMLALDMARDAVFLLGGFSVGTPIEAWHRIVQRRRSAVIVWPFPQRSVFVDFMGQQRLVTVVKSLTEAIDVQAVLVPPR